MTEIRWNPNLEELVAEIAGPAIAELASKRTRQYDELIASHRDGDADVVKAELGRIYAADGGDISDPELTQHAEAIVAGQRIVFQPGS